MTANELRKFLIDNNLSSAQLADMLRITRRTVDRWIKGAPVPFACEIAMIHLAKQ